MDGIWRTSNGWLSAFPRRPRADWERRIKKEGFIRELYEAIGKAKPNPAHYALAERARKLREASARRKEVNKWGNLTRTEAGLYHFYTIDLSESD